MREAALDQRHGRGEKAEARGQTGDKVEGADYKDGQQTPVAAAPVRGEQQVDDQHDAGDHGVSGIDDGHIGWMPPDEAQCRQDRADHAVTVFDHRSHFGVVRGDVDQQQRHDPHRVHRHPPQEGGALDGRIVHEPRVEDAEEPRVHRSGQRRIRQCRQHRKAEEPEEEDAATAEESPGADAAAAGVPIEDAAAQEQPEGAGGQHRRANSGRRALAVEQLAVRAHRRGATDDRQAEGRGAALRELVPPVEIDAAGNLCRRLAGAELPLEGAAHGQGPGQRHDGDGDPQHQQGRGKADHAAPAVGDRGERRHCGPRGRRHT